MSRVLTGVQSTGIPHLGNLLGAILPAVEMSNHSKNEAFLFIADMHSLTQIKQGDRLRENTYSTAAAWLACGVNTDKTVFFRQSDVPEVTELTWYLSCFFPYQRLSLAHSFKDKSHRLADINARLFTYPMLMAADILLYDAEIVPVGKDQLQHIEMTRDVAKRFNAIVGKTLVPPVAKIQEDTQLVLGTDGEKMSKSKNNTINLFQPDKKLRKQVMSIKTDSKSLGDPKNPETDTTFALYQFVADPEAVAEMRQRYERGNYGYGDAKKELLDCMIAKYGSIRERYFYFMENKSEIDQVLEIGAQKARKAASDVLHRVRVRLGY